MGTLEEQLAEAYSVLDEMDNLTSRLRRTIDDTVTNLKRECPGDPEQT